MTVKSDASTTAAALTANAKSIAIGKGAQLGDMMTSIQQHAIGLDRRRQSGGA